MRSPGYAQLGDDQPLDPRAVPEPPVQQTVSIISVTSTGIEAPPLLLGEENPEEAAERLLHLQSPSDKDPSGHDEKRWRRELVELRDLVKDQQTRVHRQIQSLHKEQQKQLQEAISRVESAAAARRTSALEVGAPVVKTNSGVAGSSKGVPEKLRHSSPPSPKDRKREEKSEDAGKNGSGVGHPCAVSPRDAAEAAEKPEDFEPDSVVTNKEVAGNSPNGHSSQAARGATDSLDVLCGRDSDDSEIPVRVKRKPRTLCDNFRRCYQSGVRFMELARLHYGDRVGTTTPWSLEGLVGSIYFRAAVSIAILVNGICIGFQVDATLQAVYQRAQWDDPLAAVVENPEKTWRGAEILFCIFFTTELVLRAAAERASFAFGENWAWNVFDFCLVFFSIVDLIFSADGMPDFSFARILRLVRFTRVLRILRAMRSYQSLRVMVVSILSSMTALLWVFLLLLFMIYFFAVFFVSGVADYFHTRFEANAGIDGDLVDTVRAHYGSVMDTILSLFMCISGGRDWIEMVDPLFKISILYVVLFVVYIFFMAFGVLNVVVGHFVDNAQRASQKDRESVVKNELRQEKEYCIQMQNIFREADKDNDGQLSWNEFEDYLKTGTAAAYFASAGLDAAIARTLFLLLDVDDTDQVGIEEFVGGCMRLRGGARSIDVNMLLYETEKMCYKLTEFMQDTTSTLKKMSAGGGVALEVRPSDSSPKDRDQELQECTSPLNSLAPSRSASGLSRASMQLREFRRRPVRPCAALAGSELKRSSRRNDDMLDDD